VHTAWGFPWDGVLRSEGHYGGSVSALRPTLHCAASVPQIKYPGTGWVPMSEPGKPLARR